ncbi:GAF domain-containing protein [uncultured Desulfobacter sp.]|uniref:GAF domain-containing protein n=1 Tax=uncultured Desulfobacter sp. TaxID=240139 RepID=UPI0029F54C73|nr:GAF domain-containing protein [uncultured Desulfobacter sp.]
MEKNEYDNDLVDFMQETIAADNYRDLAARVLKSTAKRLSADIGTLWRAVKYGDEFKLILAGTYNVEFLPKEEEPTYTIPAPTVKNEEIQGLTAWIAVRKRLLKIETPNQLNDPNTSWAGCHAGKWDNMQFWTDNKFGSLIGYPLTLNDKLLGVIKLERYKSSQPFSNSDCDRGKKLAKLIIISLKGMIARENQEKKRQESLRELSSMLRTADSASYYDNIVRFIAKILEADICTLWLYEKGKKVLTLASQFGLNPAVVKTVEDYSLPEADYVTDKEIKGLTVWTFIRNRPFYAHNWEKLSSHPSHIGKWDNAQWNSKPREEFGCLYSLPLYLEDYPIGVIKIERRKKNGYRPFDEVERSTLDHIAVMVSLAPPLKAGIKGLKDSLSSLIKLGTIRDKQEVLHAIADEAANLIGSKHCEIYTLDDTGENITLNTFINAPDGLTKTKINVPYRKGEGLTGWVFKTGKPLNIKNIKDFENSKKLTDEELSNISDGTELNEDSDRIIQWSDKSKRYPCVDQFLEVPFIAVPIKSKIGEILGVLRVIEPKKKRAFTRDDMNLLLEFSKIISLILYNESQNSMIRFLIQFNKKSNQRAQFDFAVDEILKLVPGNGCSIFLKQSNRDRNQKIKLMHTSSEYLKVKEKQSHISAPIDMSYDIGEGKTGFVAANGHSLLINYYGRGHIQKKRMKYNYEKFSNYKNNKVEYLNDNNGQHVGIIRLFNKANQVTFSESEINDFLDFSSKYIVDEKGRCVSESGYPCETGINSHAPNFLGVPLKSKTGDIIGVLRIARTYNGGRFSYEELRLVESISGFLASALEIQEKLHILSDINSKITSFFGKDEILDEILRVITEILGYEFAAIQQLHHGMIKTVRVRQNSKFKNLGNMLHPAQNPENWLHAEHVRHPPSDERKDIHAYILDTKEAIVIKGFSDYFDKEIYKNNHHEELIRAFVPIIAYESTTGQQIEIGTLEVGHNIHRKDFIDYEELEMLKAVANQVAITIRNREQVWSKLLRECSHQMREYLTPQKSTVKRMINGLLGEINDIQKDRLQLVYSTILDQEVLVENLLDLVSLVQEQTSLNKTLFSLSKLTEEVVEVFSSEAKDKKLILDYDKPAEDIEIMADKNKIIQIIRNLIANAIKFTDNGMVSVCVRKFGKTCEVAISDTGPGVPKEFHKKIFEEFFRVDKTAKGTGLGLSIAKKYVEYHGGEIRFENQVPHGSSFIFTIP